MRPARTARMIPWLMVVCLLTLPAPAQYSGGSGTAEDPYQIATAEDLIALGESPDDYDKHFILTADIDLDPNLPGGRVFGRAVIAPDVNETEDWFQGSPFSGVLDGNGHTISHLMIQGQNDLGLFGKLDSHASISNLGLEAIDVNATGHCVGSLAGSNVGNITNCYSTGTVSGLYNVGGLVGENIGTISTSHNVSRVSGEDWAIGGLVGYNENSIDNSYSTGTVTGDEEVGGLVGDNWHGHIIMSYSTGEVSADDAVGGLVGDNDGSIVTSYSTGKVGGHSNVGGLVGDNVGSIVTSYSSGRVAGGVRFGGLVGRNYAGSITASFWDTQTSGQTTSAGGTGKTTAEMQAARTFVEAGWDFVGERENGTDDVWKIVEGQTYPLLSWQKYGGGTGEPNDPYLIYTAGQMNEIGLREEHWDKHFVLMENIDLSGFDGKDNRPKYNIIARDTNDLEDGFQGTAFTGTFNGNRHTISNFTWSSTDRNYIGIFGCMNKDGEVRDLGLENSYVDAGRGEYVGALAGRNGGLIANCYATGRINADGDQIGGLVGDNCYGTIINCHVTTAVMAAHGEEIGGLAGANSGGAIINCYATGNITARDEVGGLVGDNGDGGAVRQCYATGAVGGGNDVGGLVGCNDAGDVTHCYSTGAVSGDENVGGLIGEGRWIDVIDSFWDIETSGQVESAGGTGIPTALMQMERTFTSAGWDFIDETDNGTDDIWWILEGQGYPRLWWEEVLVLIVDDFESYTDDVDASEAIFQTWVVYNDHVVANGALVGHLLPPFAEQTIVHGGSQSMPFSYDNTEDVVNSWAERRWGPPRHWTIDDADTLTLYFRGEADNDREPLYVAIQDRAGHIAAITHPDADAVLVTEWQKWHIPLADLQAAGVDVASVKAMVVGVGDRDNPQPGGEGVVYIDDIWVTKRLP